MNHLNGMGTGQQDGFIDLDKRPIEQGLQQLLSDCTGSVAALVVTDDGFVVAQVIKREMAVKSLAAITSSLMGLSESMVQETAQKACRNVIIEAEAGNIVTLRINSTRVLTAIASRNASLGMLLSSAKTCAEELASVLEQTHAERKLGLTARESIC